MFEEELPFDPESINKKRKATIVTNQIGKKATNLTDCIQVSSKLRKNNNYHEKENEKPTRIADRHNDRQNHEIIELAVDSWFELKFVVGGIFKILAFNRTMS